MLRATRKGARASLRQQRQEVVLEAPAEQGVCHPRSDGWQLFGEVFATFVEEIGGSSRGAIWLDEETQTLYQGHDALDALTPKEQAVLAFFAVLPKTRHTYTDIIVSAWSDEERYHVVTNDSLLQVICGSRHKIEPNPAEPIYMVNWRGRPEGGYLFYPEGRPA